MEQAVKARAAVLGAGLLAGLSGTAAEHTAFTGRENALFHLYYQMEVAGYCSLVSAAVARGFARRADTLERNLLDERRDHIRGKAWQAAHAEWQNRGLGGFRAWCANEGRAAADWLGAGPR